MTDSANHQLELDLELSRNGSPWSATLTQNRIKRANTTSEQAVVLNHVFGPHNSPEVRSQTLWVIDRILEPQTMAHFIECAITGNLPSGEQSSLPRLEADDVGLLQQPLSTWAASSFSDNSDIPLEKISEFIGSKTDSSRLIPISKELHAIKARVWEGIPPLSERRWRELQLDEAANFHNACQYFCAVINVFHYLNSYKAKMCLRETYNRIWRCLKTFEDALNVKKTAESKPSVPVAALWHEYIKDLFNHISDCAHRWVMTHIERLRSAVLESIANHNPPKDTKTYDEVQWFLTNKLHDLTENVSQADSAIFMPMDGYYGEELSAQDDAPEPDYSNPYRKKPIKFAANTLHRKGDYFCRVKYLSRVETYSGIGHRGLFRLMNDPQEIVMASKTQIVSQNKARAELRGVSKPDPQPLWLREALRQSSYDDTFEWGYIAYRLSHDLKDDEWEAFKAKFEADALDWGEELAGAEELKSRGKIIWRDAQDFGIADGDVDSVKKHFQESAASTTAIGGVFSDILLIADHASVSSYLKPQDSSAGGYILVIDVEYDPTSEHNRPDESPGYNGFLRVLGSHLWDDLGALILMQTQHLADLWPLALQNRRKVYEGPLALTSTQ